MRIRTRLTLQFILLTAGIFTAALFFIYTRFEQHVEHEFFTLLESKARMTAEMLLRHEETLRPLPPPGGQVSMLPPTSNISIFDAQKQRVFALNSGHCAISPEQLSTICRDGASRFKQSDCFIFGAIVNSATGHTYIVVSEDKPDYSKLRPLRNILLVTFFMVMAAIAAGGWFYAGQALAPVLRIVNEVDALLPVDLSRRLRHADQRDEMSHLAATFNRLLDRIEHAFQMQRSFISNVSHELRNPLAAMNAQLQLTRNRPRSVEAYDQVLTSLHDDVRDMTDTTDKLLQLANVHSNAANIAFEPLRLDELLYQTRDALLKTHPDYVVRIEINNLPVEESGLCTVGNEALLRTALLNLLDNGCKFSPDHTVRAGINFAPTGQCSIDIRNNGQGIPEADLPRIFDPFFRSGQHSRLKGSGVGLSLVQSILRLHRIDMQARNMAGGGVQFRLTFPVQWTEQPTPTDIQQSVFQPSSTFRWPQKFAFFFKKNISNAAAVLLLALIVTGCASSSAPNQVGPTAHTRGVAVLQDWNNMLLELNRNSEGYRPPVSARMYAYMGIAAWESASPALPGACSLGQQFPGLQLPARPTEVSLEPALALNAAYIAMTQYFFSHTTMLMREKCRQLSDKHAAEIGRLVSPEVRESSERYGTAVAAAICRWSATDSVGHQAHLFNFDRDYHSPKGAGQWFPSDKGLMPALLPHWGEARTFCTRAEPFTFHPPLPFSAEGGSTFFAQAMEVYALSEPLADEKRWIAEFWSDDFPGVSFCAASRWISIARQLVEQQQISFTSALQMYLYLGLALNDAAVICWREKYHFNVERPDSYIRRNIRHNWEPLHPAPPFPAYPSGHASFGAAATTVFEHILGPRCALTDRSHEQRREFNGTPRTFQSFKEMSSENALSRLFMGVHYRMDAEEGMRLGVWAGNTACNIPLWQPGYSVVR